MSSENSNSKFGNKDWIYIFIISLFLQFIIYYFSFIYGGSVKALGYISFAGTIISIILAVIAIGYTYGESIRQKTSSDQLLVEISGLRDIKDKLAGQVDLLENIAAIKSAVEQTETAVKGIDFEKQFSKLLKTEFKGESKSPPNITKEQTEKIIMSFEYISDLHIFRILNKIKNNNLVEVVDLIPSLIDDNLDDSSGWIPIANLYTAIYFMCISLGLIVDSQISEETLDVYRKKYPKDRDVSTSKREIEKLIDTLLYNK